MTKSFEDLEVWQIGKNIVMEAYQLTTHFPKEESFVLTSQIRRAALSVPANITEGSGRYHYLDKAKFYLNARGSLYELKSHLLIVTDQLDRGSDLEKSLDGILHLIDHIQDSAVEQGMSKDEVFNLSEKSHE